MCFQGHRGLGDQSMIQSLKLLVLSRFTDSAAGTRFRLCAYFPVLERRGWTIDFRPFVDDAFLSRFYSSGSTAWKIRRVGEALFQRARLYDHRTEYDAVLVYRGHSFIGPRALERGLSRTLPLIFDFDVAIWLPDHENTGQSVFPIAARTFKFPGKAIQIMKRATAVIAGNHALGQFARAVADDVTVIPRVVSRESWRPAPDRLSGAFVDASCPVIGWVGSHSTPPCLSLVGPALRQLHSEGLRFKVRVVGAGHSLPDLGVRVEPLVWRKESELDSFRPIDIGIAPAPSNEWTEGKCGFKQIQYMAMGIPHVGSPVGAAREFIVHGRNGLLASTTEEWAHHLRALLTHQTLRARIAQNARTLVEQTLCTEAQGPRMADAIDRAWAAHPRRAAS